jgi:hypothetical protein
MNTVITVGMTTWILTALVLYVFLRRVAFNLFDPLLVLAIFLPFSASLLAVLCQTELISWDKFWLFSLVLLGYLGGGYLASRNFRLEAFRAQIIATLASIRGSEAKAILLATLAITMVLALLGLESGASGDARQSFGRVFRPLLVLQNGLFLFSLMLLLSRRLSLLRALTWLVPLMVLSIPFSGKGVVVPALFWLGLRLYLNRRRITLRTATIASITVIAGVTCMVLIAYGKSNLLTAFAFIGTRFWLSGDVYIYAYQSDALAAVRNNTSLNFISYMLHPLTSLVGIRAYDKPLGSLLASQVNGEDVLTGPNPQLPVLLDYFFPDASIACALIAFVIGFLVIGIRPLGMRLARSRSRYLRLGGIVAAIFCPAAGFIDTSQVLITWVGIAAIALGCMVLEIMLPAHAGSGSAPPTLPALADRT